MTKKNPPEKRPLMWVASGQKTIRGHVFCRFLALVFRKELDSCLERAGHCFEWAEIKQDLEALQDVTITEQNKTLAVRTACVGTCGKVFQAVGVAIPSTVREMQIVKEP
jgi:hypothetical protein